MGESRSSRKYTKKPQTKEKPSQGKELVPGTEEFTRSILYSLSENIAILDKNGLIVAVNEAWIRFARENGGAPFASIGPGTNYLDVCRRSSDQDDKIASAALDGIQSVLDGSQELFTMVYPCHSPEEKRWFLLKVQPVKPSGDGVIISHINVTECKKTEDLLHESEKRMSYFLEAVTEGTYDWNVRTGEVYYSPRMIQSLGYSPDEVPGHVSFWESIVHPDDMPRVQKVLKEHLDGKTEIYEVEDRLRMKSGEYRWNLARGRVVERDADGKPLRMVGIDTDITERKRIEEVLKKAKDDLEIRVQERTAEFMTVNRQLQTEIAERKRAQEILHESEERFRALAENTSDWIWEVDQSLVYTYASPKVRDLLGYEPDEVIGKTPFDLMPEYEARRISEIFRPVLASRKPFTSLENINLHKDGHHVIIETSGVPIFNKSGHFYGYRGIDRDITERKRNEEELRESELRLHKLSDNLPNGLVYQVDSGEDGLQRRFLYISAGVEQLHGITVAEALNDAMSIYGQIIAEDRLRLAEEEAFAVANTVPFRTEVRLQLPSGEIRWRLFTSAPRRLPNNHLVWDGIEIDITERKRAEEIVKTERKRLYDVLETLPVYVILLTPDYHVTFANRFFRERFGESRGKRCFEYLFGRKEPCENCETYTTLKFKAPHHWAWTGPDGRNYDIYDFPFADTDGSTLILEMGIDVTERLQAEKALQEVNKTLEQRVAERTAVLDGINRIFRAALTSVTEEELCRACLSIIEEVTRSRFGFIGEIGQDGLLHDIAVSDPGWELCTMYDKNTGHRRPPGKFSLHGLYGRVLIDGKAFYTNEPSSHPDSIGTPEGHPPLRAFLGAPLLHSGQTIGMIVLGNREGGYIQKDLDLLEALAPAVVEALFRVRAEMALKQSEARLNRSQEVAHLGSWELDLVDNVLTWSDEVYRIFGLRPQQFAATYEAFLESVHPDDRAAVDAAYSGSVREGKDKYEIEHRIVRRSDGEVRIVHEKCDHFRDSSGRIIRSVGIVHDITEHKAMLKTLEKALVEIRNLKEQLEAENIYLREEMRVEQGFEEIIGESDALKYVLYRVSQVAPTDMTVLIRGETGTGKGQIAYAIHKASNRKEKPLIHVNCAALPANLIESEMFGREKGAFTGAEARQIGRFELADKGTIFLDEIGELSLTLQAKLLRVIEDGAFERLGSPHTVKVDVRIIASTNRNLEEEIREGRFREDLFYRLNVFPITVPPLRQRAEDILLLVRYFVNKFNARHGRNITKIPKPVIEALQGYPWPGNVRELANVIERAVIISHGHVLELSEKVDIPMIGPVREKVSERIETKETKGLVDVEREHILKTLRESGWRIEGSRGAAQILGMNPSTLRGRMKKLGIKRPKAH